MVEHDYNVFRPKHNRWVDAGIIVLMLLGVGFCWLNFALHPGRGAYVVGLSWDRTILIEQYGPHEEESWCDDGLPDGAYNVSRARADRTSESILARIECGDMQVENDGVISLQWGCRPVYRQEPVYDDRCYYTVDRWEHSRRVAASGDSNTDELYWPDPDLNCEGQTQHGCEREFRRNENYALSLNREQTGEVFTCRVDLNRWLNANPGDRFYLAMEVYWAGPYPDCTMLKELRWNRLP